MPACVAPPPPPPWLSVGIEGGVEAPPLVPCGGLTGGVFPVQPAVPLAPPPAPPPEPPLPPEHPDP